MIEKFQEKLVKFMFHKNLIQPVPEGFNYLREKENSVGPKISGAVLEQ
jgi:hypothetical protein